MKIKKTKRQALVDKLLCVGCGCCMKVCINNAITIPKGINAEIEESRCAGCSLCAQICPASVIEMVTV